MHDRTISPPRWMRPLAAASAVAVLALLAACNTVEGVGKDVQSAGEGIEGAAEGARN